MKTDRSCVELFRFVGTAHTCGFNQFCGAGSCAVYPLGWDVSRRSGDRQRRAWLWLWGLYRGVRDGGPRTRCETVPRRRGFPLACNVSRAWPQRAELGGSGGELVAGVASHRRTKSGGGDCSSRWTNCCDRSPRCNASTLHSVDIDSHPPAQQQRIRLVPPNRPLSRPLSRQRWR